MILEQNMAEESEPATISDESNSIENQASLCEVESQRSSQLIQESPSLLKKTFSNSVSNFNRQFNKEHGLTTVEPLPIYDGSIRGNEPSQLEQ